MKYENIIDNIIELASDKLNDWETGFIDSVQVQILEKKFELTDKQKQCILKIQNKYLKY